MNEEKEWIQISSLEADAELLLMGQLLAPPGWGEGWVDGEIEGRRDGWVGGRTGEAGVMEGDGWLDGWMMA